MKTDDVEAQTLKPVDVDPKTKYENEYATCCSKSGKTDARLIRYVSKFTFSMITLIFAGAQIIRAGECDPLVPFYSSLITYILGAWIHSNNNKQINTLSND